MYRIKPASKTALVMTEDEAVSFLSFLQFIDRELAKNESYLDVYRDLATDATQALSHPKFSDSGEVKL